MNGSVGAPEWEYMYSVKEVAGILRVDRETVRRWILNEELRAIVLPHKSNCRKRVYKSRRVGASELERFIESRTTDLSERKRRIAA